jgi:DNA polymerase-1
MFNPNSPQQVSALLYDQWKLPKQYNEKRVGRQVVKTLTTDNEARKRLRKYVAGLPEKYQETYKPARIFLDLQDYLEGEKTKLTFLDRISSDGRLHPYFKSHGTSSFRLSSSPNLQNWPVYDVSKWGGARRDTESEGAAVPTGEKLEGEMGSLRSIVIPDDPENDVILTADFGQIEIWMYAVQTGCKWLLDIYHKGEYIYGAFYEQFYKLPFFQSGKPRTKKYKLPDISEKYLRRTKAIPLGWLYGRSDAAIAEEHGISTSDVFVITNGMARACPEIVAQYSRDEFQMNQKGYVRYPFGHLIHFPSRKVTEVKAMRGQNPAGGMLLTSIVLLYDEFVRRKYENTRLMLTVHDSFSFNIPRHKCIEVYEQSIGPILSRPVQELGGFVFPHSCEVSAPKFDPYGKFLEPGRWDWDVEDYKDWKERQGDKA